MMRSGSATWNSVAQPLPTSQDSSGLMVEKVDLPECTICVCALSDDIAALRCGHVFHHKCIEASLKKKAACPNCRQVVRPNEVIDLVFTAQGTRI